MNKSLLLCLACTAFFSCKNEKTETLTDSSDSSEWVQKKPVATGNNIPNRKTIQIGRSSYAITTTCMTDEAAPLVTDELGQGYYANKVRVKVTKDNDNLFEHTFEKADFSSLLSDKEMKGTILQGMNFFKDKSSASSLCFIAQVGEPGLDGGSIFLIKVDTQQGSFSIEKMTEVIPEEMEPTVSN